MPIKSPRLQLSYNAIGKRKENVVNLQRVGKREGVWGRRRAERGPLRHNVALTMWGGDTQIASTFTRSRQHKCDYDYVTNVCVCLRVCVSAEVTFVCRWLWLDLCVCCVCERDGATPLWLLWNLAHKLYYCIYAWFYFRLLDNRHVIVRVLNCPAVWAIKKERAREWRRETARPLYWLLNWLSLLLRR